MSKSIDKEKKWDFKINLSGIIIGGIIVFLSNIMMVYVSRTDKRREESQTILNKKIELLDKTTKMFYGLPGIEEEFNFHFNNNIDTFHYSSLSGLQIVPKSIEISKELSEVRATFFSTLLLDKLYFGPKTPLVIDSIFNQNKKLNKSWWQTPDTSYIKLLTVMASELK